MVILPLGEVVDLVADDDPAVLEGVVRCNFGPRDLAIALPRLCGDPQVLRNLFPYVRRRLPLAEVPRAELLRRQRLADLPGVERIDPRIVVAGPLLVIEDWVVTL